MMTMKIMSPVITKKTTKKMTVTKKMKEKKMIMTFMTFMTFGTLKEMNMMMNVIIMNVMMMNVMIMTKKRVRYKPKLTVR